MVKGNGLNNYLKNVFWGPSDPGKFAEGIQHVINYLPPKGVFAGDNIFTFCKNLSFLEDTRFMEAFSKHVETDIEKAIIWRTHVLCWAAKRMMRVEGDFVECACYKGISARIICDYVDLGKSEKHFYLYDLFEHSPEMAHHAMDEHSDNLYETVKNRFSDLDRVHVTKGFLPDVLEAVAPEKIALLHIDLNNAPAELGVLKYLFDRVSPGGIIILDDYGWLAYRAQKDAEDPFFAEHGYTVLELPTGQGLVLK